MLTFHHESADLHQLLKTKYVEKLFFLRETIYKFQASCFNELSFFPRAEVLCLVKCDEGRFSSSVFNNNN